MARDRQLSSNNPSLVAMRILVVDDELETAQTVALLLEDARQQVNLAIKASPTMSHSSRFAVMDGS